MKKKVAAHLSTLFPRLRGIDFEQIEKVGQTSIQLMINDLIPFGEDMTNQIERNEKELEKLGSNALFDTMEATEVASYIAYLRIRLGNRKLAISNLNTLLSGMKSKDIKKDYPALPSLRNPSHFMQGDDVMVYVGETGLESKEVPYDRNALVTKYNWVCGKVLLCTDHPGEQPIRVFLNQKTWVEGSLEGRYYQNLTTSPVIFKRSEFYKIRSMFNTTEDSEFLELFLKNCEKTTFRYKIESWEDAKILKMILDTNVEEIEDKALKAQEMKLISEAVQITEKEGLFLNEAREMAVQRKIKLPEQ